MNQVNQSINEFFNGIDYSKPLSEYSSIFEYSRLEGFMKKIIIFLFIFIIAKFVFLYTLSLAKRNIKRANARKGKLFKNMTLIEQQKYMNKQYKDLNSPSHIYYRHRGKLTHEQKEEMLECLRSRTTTPPDKVYKDTNHEICSRLKHADKRVGKYVINLYLKEYKEVGKEIGLNWELLYFPVVLLLFLFGFYLL